MSTQNAISGGLQGAGTGASIGSIVPGIGTALGAGIGGLLGGLGGLLGGGDSPETEALKKQQAAYEQLKILPPEQRQIQLAYLQNVGHLSPEMENAIQQQQSELKSINTDPALRQAQMNTLNKLQQVGSQGLTDQDIAGLNQIRRDAGQQNQGTQGAIMQNLAARGQLGSGGEIAARLQAAQTSADNAQRSGENQATQAQARALQGMMASGNLASQLQSNQFNQQAQTANAQDLINRFNTQSGQNVANANVQASNRAQESNFDYAKQLAASNQQITNAQRAGNQQALAGYNNDLNLQTLGKAGVGVNVGHSQTQDQQSQGQGLNNTISGIGALANTLINTKNKKNPDDNAPAASYNTAGGGDGSNYGSLV